MSWVVGAPDRPVVHPQIQLRDLAFIFCDLVFMFGPSGIGLSVMSAYAQLVDTLSVVYAALKPRTKLCPPGL